MKQKIFDVIFFYNEINLLDKRIEYMGNHVTKFIILNFGPIHLNTYQDNILVYKMSFRKTPFFRNNFLEYLFYLFDFDDFKYDDFFIFSKVDELPDLESLFSEINPKSFIPLVLNHTNYAWSHLLQSKESYFGSRIFQYTNFLQNTHLHHSLYNNNPLLWNAQIIDNGFRLFGFGSLETLELSKNFWYDESPHNKTNFLNLLDQHNSINYDEKIIHHTLVENTLVPIHFHSLSHEIKNSEKSILLLDLAVSDNEIHYNFNGQQNIEIINYPSRVLYSDKNYEDFQSDFKKNEILRILKKLPIENIKHIEIKKTTETVVFDMEEIINSVPSELF
jgi:hypothetical protein